MVKINGEALAVAGKTLAEYLAGTDYNPKRIAVERNGEIVPKAAYGETILHLPLSTTISRRCLLGFTFFGRR